MHEIVLDCLYAIGSGLLCLSLGYWWFRSPDEVHQMHVRRYFLVPPDKPGRFYNYLTAPARVKETRIAGLVTMMIGLVLIIFSFVIPYTPAGQRMRAEKHVTAHIDFSSPEKG